MEIQTFVDQFPRLYHSAEPGSWPLIAEHGLRSTSALMDLFECPPDVREQIEARHRPNKIPITHPIYGTAVVRDQKPMSDAALRKVLVDGSPADWYRLLNGKVFFWPTEKRLKSFLGARAYRTSNHVVITVASSRLFARHKEQVTLSPINSGATLYKPVPRGQGTFQSIDDYPFDEWKRKRSPDDAVAEVAVEYGVLDISTIALAVTEWTGPVEGRRIWTADSPG